MIAIAVDNERPMLAALTEAVAACDGITSVKAFDDCGAALAWVKRAAVDVAFLDIHMPQMNGLALAAKILALRPKCRIIFCTANAGYALDAFRLHASGYLLKPVTAQAVQAEIDHIRNLEGVEKRLSVKCFGDFEVFCQGKLLDFRRGRTKELLAFLVDRNGAGVTARQICAGVWEADDAKNINYFYQLLADLRHTLQDVGAGDVLVKSGTRYAVDTSLLDCDYYNYLKTGKPAFHGEYMTQYSWAEATCALLWQKEKQI